jgi:hypothetical protein
VFAPTLLLGERNSTDVRMAQWIRRLPTEQEILGSSPSTDSLFFFFLPSSTQSTQTHTHAMQARNTKTNTTRHSTHWHNAHNKKDCIPMLCAGRFWEKGGDARIELATSCTRSRNHTTRPITQLYDCTASNSKERDVLELNQRPIGLQPIALPLS